MNIIRYLYNVTITVTAITDHNKTVLQIIKPWFPQCLFIRFHSYHNEKQKNTKRSKQAKIPCPFEAVSMQKQLFIADAGWSRDAALPLTAEMIYIRITELRTLKPSTLLYLSISSIHLWRKMRLSSSWTTITTFLRV